jgi:hypothetical protein
MAKSMHWQTSPYHPTVFPGAAYTITAYVSMIMEPLLESARRKPQSFTIYIDKNRLGATVDNGVTRGDESQRLSDHQIPGLDSCQS